jgi:hypothetical protein
VGVVVGAAVGLLLGGVVASGGVAVAGSGVPVAGSGVAVLGSVSGVVSGSAPPLDRLSGALLLPSAPAPPRSEPGGTVSAAFFSQPSGTRRSERTAATSGILRALVMDGLRGFSSPGAHGTADASDG